MVSLVKYVAERRKRSKNNNLLRSFLEWKILFRVYNVLSVEVVIFFLFKRLK